MHTLRLILTAAALRMLLQEFHAPWRVRALLPHLWLSCRQLEVDAEYLQLEEVPSDVEVFEVRRELGQFGSKEGDAAKKT